MKYLPQSIEAINLYSRTHGFVIVVVVVVF